MPFIDGSCLHAFKLPRLNAVLKDFRKTKLPLLHREKNVLMSGLKKKAHLNII